MIMFGNLSIRQVEERLGIELSDKERAELNACHEDNCGKVQGRDVWHCYDMPFEMVVGSRKMADVVCRIFSPYSANRSFLISWQYRTLETFINRGWVCVAEPLQEQSMRKEK